MPNWPLGRTQSTFAAVTVFLCIAGAVSVGGLPTVLDPGRATDSHSGDGLTTTTSNRSGPPTADHAPRAAAESGEEFQGQTTPTPAADDPQTPTTDESRDRTASTPPGTADDRRFSYTVGQGANATAVRVVDSGRPGPTVLVIGGLHGDEPAGYRAAHDVAGWRIDRGTLVVIPEANPRAVRNGTRKVNGRDLNAKFPVDERPATAQARLVWRVVRNHDPDVVIDLHSSKGIYGVDDGVGQAIFPSVTGDAVAHADTTTRSMNEAYDLAGNRSFRRGNGLGPSGQTLTRKAIGDRDATAYIVETTKRNTTLETRVEWTKAITWELLRLHGVVDQESYQSAS